MHDDMPAQRMVRLEPSGRMVPLVQSRGVWAVVEDDDCCMVVHLPSGCGLAASYDHPLPARFRESDGALGLARRLAEIDPSFGSGRDAGDDSPTPDDIADAVQRYCAAHPEAWR